MGNGRSSWAVTAVTLVTGMVPAAPTEGGAVHYVPDDHASIGVAITAAQPGIASKRRR